MILDLPLLKGQTPGIGGDILLYFLVFRDAALRIKLGQFLLLLLLEQHFLVGFLAVQHASESVDSFVVEGAAAFG